MSVQRRHELDLLLVTLPPCVPSEPPLALAALAAFADANGFRVKMLDLNVGIFHRVAPHLRELWLWEKGSAWGRKEILLQLMREQIEWAADRILEVDAPVVGFSLWNRREPVTCEVIKAICERAGGHEHGRGASRRFILGGPACVERQCQQLVQREVPWLVDAIVVGEGEQSLLGYLERVEDRGTERRDPRADLLVAPGPIADLDSLPVPCLDQLPLELYSSRRLVVEWSRGCIGRCAFCQIAANWPGPRRKSPPRIYRELAELKQRTGIVEFTVCDSILNGDSKALAELCDLLIARPLDVHWSGNIVAARWMTDESTRRLARAGCTYLEIGLESGSDRVLRRIRKPFDVQTARDNLASLKRAGISTGVSLLVGFPGETEEDFQATVEFVATNRALIDRVSSINTLVIQEGTPLYREPQRFQIDWSGPGPVPPWEWEDSNGTDLAARHDRLRRLRQVCEEVGLGCEQDNIHFPADGYDVLPSRA